jgi:hypothetical protein
MQNNVDFAIITGIMNEKQQHITAVCRNGGFRAFLETFVLAESSRIFSNFGAENPPLLQAAKRWAIF